MSRAAKEEILKSELIGKKITVADSTNKQIMTFTGIIIDETKNSFVVRSKKGDKRLMKADSTFRIRIQGNEHGNGNSAADYEIEGVLLQKRPHERIKTKFK